MTAERQLTAVQFQASSRVAFKAELKRDFHRCDVEVRVVFLTAFPPEAVLIAALFNVAANLALDTVALAEAESVILEGPDDA